MASPAGVILSPPAIRQFELPAWQLLDAMATAEMKMAAPKMSQSAWQELQLDLVCSAVT